MPGVEELVEELVVRLDEVVHLAEDVEVGVEVGVGVTVVVQPGLAKGGVAVVVQPRQEGFPVVDTHAVEIDQHLGGGHVELLIRIRGELVLEFLAEIVVD